MRKESLKIHPADYISIVSRNERLSKRHFLLVLSRPEGFPDPSPGNFLHVAIPSSDRFFLRRPISILFCTLEEIGLLVVEKGDGTRILRNIQAGSKLKFIGPLGNSFPLLVGKRVLGVAGGVGLAPLYYYATSTAKTGDLRLAYGARCREDLFLDFLSMERVCSGLATDDGSFGFRGDVVELAVKMAEGEKVDAVFSCGPLGMLKKLVSRVSTLNVPHYVSLENRMACALGVCRSCVVPVTGDNGICNQTVCNDGPVFEAKKLVWNKLPLL